MREKVSVIIPAYNEGQRIGATVKAASTIAKVTEVLVVDDGSRDATGVVARRAGAKVLTLPRNQGKGKALTKGISSISNNIILLLDADLGDTAVQADLLLAPLLAGEADMTIGVFPPVAAKTGLGIALGLARLGTKLLTGLTLQAPLSGQRGFTREALWEVQPFLPGFGVEVGLNVRAARRGLRIKEIPVGMKHRNTGLNFSGLWHRGRQFCHILLALLHLFWEDLGGV
ncbi:MAG: glycosyltransferase family 2 protein [Firmicutes bacterium]|nr:glycosyltransferase family 2 protein [Bacillota bacterium]